MKQQRDALMTALNSGFKNFFKNVSIPDENRDPLGRPVHYAHAWAEYRRQAREIQRRFGGETGDVLGFGQDDCGQIGYVLSKDEDKPTTYLPFVIKSLVRKDVRQISAGGVHSLAVTADGDAYSWGTDDDGTLGRKNEADTAIDATTPSPVVGFRTVDGINEDRQIVQVCAGASHSLFLSYSGNVYSSGMMKDMDSGKFRDIQTVEDDPAGYNEKPVHVALMPKKVTFISTTTAFSAAILEDGTMVTWDCSKGFGNHGELARTATMGAKKNKEGRPDLGQGFFYTTKQEDGDGNVRFVATPSLVREHFLTPKPPIWSFGSPQKKVINVACGSYHLLAVAREPDDAKLRVYSSGINNYGQLGQGDFGVETERHELTMIKALEDENIVKVACGEFHSLALNLIGTKVFAFGRADYGQLGTKLFDFGECGATPEQVAFPSEERVIIADIDAGSSHSMAITIDDEVYSWGFGDGNTGFGDVQSDVVYPRKLTLTAKQINAKGRVLATSGGGQHGLMLVKRYAFQT
ncbi:predicted protein [Phaeodactylum tricornutum CCAP 1055/1]|uniref:RCC1-like domain-containing protein n=3 Tax=Phaeodactylum tricornutum TaxID=2850 RepID=B7G1G5_PHATC|nr:predicted protein [Phaeodactylum tricornutum CCAP 1055/1]EEC47678.1 predicted protein [Phaeodactylum tricornutum CCAP 1055/1]|eukprot:XP_002181026.1 predicted protein [Phaeodactylum tricornutum CCAP 1055/1]